MHGTKRKRCHTSPSLTPPPFSSATLAEPDPNPSRLSPAPELSSQEFARIFQVFDSARSFTVSEKVTKAQVQKMRSFPEIEAALNARTRQAHIHTQTRRGMRIRTRRMAALALRDHQRQHHVPTQRTNPPLRQRRYSVDANPRYEKDKVKRARDREPLELEPDTQEAHAQRAWVFEDLRVTEELERVTSSTLPVAWPKPFRYHDFQYRVVEEPPFTDDTYLEIDGNSITNRQWYFITHTSGDEAWMQDYGLDMALKILSVQTNCSASAIAIASSFEAQICRMDGVGGKEAYAEKLGGAKYIFVPVNNGMGGQVSNATVGSHWSLLAFDCVRKVTHYIDSISVRDRDRQIIAREIFEGMLQLLGEDEQAWIIQAEHFSPNQKRDNRCGWEDEGPCGPFVYTMVRYGIGIVQNAQRSGQEEHCSLELAYGFPRWFGRWWDSLDTRFHMQHSIAAARMQQQAREEALAHDRKALEGEHVQVMSGPPVRFDVPRRPPGMERDADPESDTDDKMGFDSDKTLASDDDEQQTLPRIASPVQDVLDGSEPDPPDEKGDVLPCITYDASVTVTSKEAEEALEGVV